MVFHGRQQALRELVAWLAAPKSDGRARIVTGRPGAGKSALLACLIVLSDPVMRKHARAAGALDGMPAGTIPPRGRSRPPCTRAKNARQHRCRDSEATGETAADADELIAKLRSRTKPMTIVVDALEEAREPPHIAFGLSRPLASPATVRLLVGARPEAAPVRRSGERPA